MDTDTLVENQIDDGWKLLAQLVRNNCDVSTACWVKTGEEGRWFLYIASTVVDEKGLAAAYREVYGMLQSMDIPWISLSEVKLISPTNPIARAVLEILQRHPGRFPTRLQLPQLGNVAIEEVYIYPPTAALAAASRGKRKTKIIGRREDASGGEPRIVEEEIGTVDGILGEEIFNQGWQRLLNDKFGGIEGFASRYPKGGHFLILSANDETR